MRRRKSDREAAVISDLRMKIRAVIVQDPAGAPEAIIHWIMQAYDDLRAAQARDITRMYFVATSIGIAAAVLLGAAFGAISAHWWWHW